MPRETILNAKIWPRIGLDHAPTKNSELLKNARYKAELATQLLLYDRIVIPTNDFGIVPVLTAWIGLPNIYTLLESNSLTFIRQNGFLGYAGNGNGLNLFTMEEGDERSFEWWQKALFGTMPDALGLQIEHSLTSLASPDHNRLHDMIISHTTEFSMKNEDFIQRIANESYADVLRTPELKKVLTDYYPKGFTAALNRLPEVGPDQMRVSGIEVVNDPVDFILRIAEVNLEMAMSVQANNADIYTSEKTEKIFNSKIARCAAGHNVVDGFMRLLELINVPDIENAIINNNLIFDDVLKVRSSKNGTMFRQWLQQADIEEARDLEKAYVASLQEVPFINTLPGKTLRFIVTTAVGALQPVAGLVSGCADSYFVEKWLSGYAPKLFIDEMRALMINKKAT